MKTVKDITRIDPHDKAEVQAFAEAGEPTLIKSAAFAGSALRQPVQVVTPHNQTQLIPQTPSGRASPDANESAFYPRLVRPAPDTCDLDTANDGYAARFAGRIGDYLLEAQRQATRDLLDPFTEARILDLGGGHGQNARPLLDLGHRVTVYGSDPACAYHLADLIESQQIRFDVGDLYHLPYADREHDAVVCYRMLAHVDDIEPFVAEACRVAGRAVLVDFATMYSFNILMPLLFKHKASLEGNTRPFAMFKPSTIDRLMRKQGFKRTATIKQFVLPMVVHRKLARPGLSQAMETTLRFLGFRRLIGSPIIARYERQA
jgi:ubiquinone/menaquinone biosynthesis C-methylase UbiE